MKIMHIHPRTKGERGSAVIIVLFMLSIMSICVTVNLSVAHSLDRELKVMEKKQVQRLQHQSNPR